VDSAINKSGNFSYSEITDILEREHGEKINPHYGLSKPLSNIAVCGRIKSDYRYSKDIVYNNFPWPDADDDQKAEIAALAQGVLDARTQYPSSTLAEMYGETSMLFHTALLNAHRELDRAVMKLYGFTVKDTDEAACVAALIERYQMLVEGASK